MYFHSFPMFNCRTTYGGLWSKWNPVVNIYSENITISILIATWKMICGVRSPDLISYIGIRTLTAAFGWQY
jgi:hypothetical protein